MKPEKLVVLMPVFNDWESVDRLLVTLDTELRDVRQHARVLLVDDGSVDCWEGPLDAEFESLDTVEVLSLRRNLGHQRAICVGLCYVAAELLCDRVVVMDSDGQDDPADVPRLLAESQQQGDTKIVFGERTRRSEGILFRVLYLVYRSLHSILVGHPVRVGNFSVIPVDRLRSLTVVPELWSHYAAAVFTARLPHCSIPTHRAKRLAGRSKMQLEGLIIHGLSAISAFSDRVGVRMLTIIAPLTATAFLLLLSGVAVAVPRWATAAAGLFLILFFELLFFTLIFCFIILSNRANSRFIPVRDYAFFVDRTRTVYPQS